MNKSNLAVGVLLAAINGVACSSPDSPSTVGSGVGGNNSAGGTNTVPGGQGTAGQGTAGQGTAGQATTGATGSNTAGQGTAAGSDTGAATGGQATGGDTGAAGGGSASTGGTSTGATTGGDTGATGGAAAGGGSVSCANSDLTTIPIDETGWVASACNNVGIQGAFYCYDDGVNESGCTEGELPFTSGAGICLTGNTTEDETYAAWGAGVGFGLNESGEGADGAASVKMAYDAAANGVTGFHIVISGDTDGLPIRVAFTRVAEPDGPSPFVEVPGAGEFDVLIADALVPEAWDACTGDDCLANASGIFDIQIQVVGGEAEANYGFCIESITPITDGSAPAGGAGGGAVANYGSAVCGQYDVINNVGPFAIQNNRYNGANHCITAKWDNGSTVGFALTEVSSNIPTGGAPGSYPSVLYGWHVDGAFYGGYQSARQVSAIASATSSMSFTVPGAGRYNVSYDSWLGDSAAPGGTTNDMLEHMIWLNYRDTTPIGSNLNAPITVDGVQWDVWYGPNGGGWNTVSYIRATNTTSATVNLKAFFDDSVSRGYITDSSYLLGVQAGFEIWEASANFSVDSFTLDL